MAYKVSKQYSDSVNKNYTDLLAKTKPMYDQFQQIWRSATKDGVYVDASGQKNSLTKDEAALMLAAWPANPKNKDEGYAENYALPTDLSTKYEGQKEISSVFGMAGNALSKLEYKNRQHIRLIANPPTATSIEEQFNHAISSALSEANIDPKAFAKLINSSKTNNDIQMLFEEEPMYSPDSEFVAEVKKWVEATLGTSTTPTPSGIVDKTFSGDNKTANPATATPAAVVNTQVDKKTDKSTEPVKTKTQAPDKGAFAAGPAEADKTKDKNATAFAGDKPVTTQPPKDEKPGVPKTVEEAIQMAEKERADSDFKKSGITGFEDLDQLLRQTVLKKEPEKKVTTKKNETKPPKEKEKDKQKTKSTTPPKEEKKPEPTQAPALPAELLAALDAFEKATGEKLSIPGTPSATTGATNTTGAFASGPANNAVSTTNNTVNTTVNNSNLTTPAANALGTFAGGATDKPESKTNPYQSFFNSSIPQDIISLGSNNSTFADFDMSGAFSKSVSPTFAPESLDKSIMMGSNIVNTVNKSPLNQSVKNTIMNPVNPVVTGLNNLGSKISETNNTLSTIKTDFSGGQPSTSIVNNSSNIDNSNIQNSQLSGQGQPTDVASNQKTGQPGKDEGGSGSMSDLYLQEILNALTGHGIKIRSFA